MLQLISRATRGLAALHSRIARIPFPQVRGLSLGLQTLIALTSLGMLPGAEAAAVKQMVWVEAQGGLYQFDAKSRSLERQVPVSNIKGLVADSTGGAWVALDGTVGTSKYGRLRRVDVDGAIRADVDMKDGPPRQREAGDQCGVRCCRAAHRLRRMGPTRVG